MKATAGLPPKGLTSDDEVKHYAEDVGIIVDGPVRLVDFRPGQGGLDD